MWTGTKWAPVKRWTGAKWAPVKVWNGTAWVPTTAPPVGPTVVGTSGLVQTTTQTTMTTTYPTGLVNGDRVYCLIWCSDNSAGSVITTTAPGWATVTSLGDIGTMQRLLLSALYSGALAAPSISLTASRRSAFLMIGVRGAAATPVTALADVPASSATATAPAVTATANGLALRLYARKDGSSQSVTDAPGHTRAVAVFGQAAMADCRGVIDYQTVTAGAVAAASTTWPVASANNTSWTVAL